MKQRIIEVIDKEYGKEIARWYDIQHFKREYGGIFFGLIIPLVGWAYLITYNPFKLKWRTVNSFDTKEQAEYYLEKGEKYDTIKKAVS